MKRLLRVDFAKSRYFSFVSRPAKRLSAAILGVVKSAMPEFDEKMRAENYHRRKRLSASRSLAKLHWLMTVITDEIKLVPRAFCGRTSRLQKNDLKGQARIKQFLSRTRNKTCTVSTTLDSRSFANFILVSCPMREYFGV